MARSPIQSEIVNREHRISNEILEKLLRKLIYWLTKSVRSIRAVISRDNSYTIANLQVFTSKIDSGTRWTHSLISLAPARSSHGGCRNRLRNHGHEGNLNNNPKKKKKK